MRTLIFSRIHRGSAAALTGRLSALPIYLLIRVVPVSAKCTAGNDCMPVPFAFCVLSLFAKLDANSHVKLLDSVCGLAKTKPDEQLHAFRREREMGEL